jgi:hypothetical protein
MQEDDIPVRVASTRVVFSNHCKITQRGITPKLEDGSLLHAIKKNQENATLFVDLAIQVEARLFKAKLKEGFQNKNNYEVFGKPLRTWSAQMGILLTGNASCESVLLLCLILRYFFYAITLFSESVSAVQSRELNWDGVDLRPYMPGSKFFYAHDPENVIEKAKDGTLVWS